MRLIKQIIATCPINSEHNTFVTDVLVFRNWIVDRYGNKIEDATNNEEIHMGPSKMHSWTCTSCGSKAHLQVVCEDE